MSHSLVCLGDSARVEEVKRTLQDAVEGKNVPKDRLEAAQDFLLELLKEVNAQRPSAPVRCGGRVI